MSIQGYLIPCGQSFGCQMLWGTQGSSRASLNIKYEQALWQTLDAKENQSFYEILDLRCVIPRSIGAAKWGTCVMSQCLMAAEWLATLCSHCQSVPSSWSTGALVQRSQVLKLEDLLSCQLRSCTFGLSGKKNFKTSFRCSSWSSPGVFSVERSFFPYIQVFYFMGVGLFLVNIK